MELVYCSKRRFSYNFVHVFLLAAGKDGALIRVIAKYITLDIALNWETYVFKQVEGSDGFKNVTLVYVFIGFLLSNDFLKRSSMYVAT